MDLDVALILVGSHGALALVVILDLLNVRGNIDLADIRQGFDDLVLADRGWDGELSLDGVERAGLSPGLLALLSESVPSPGLLLTLRGVLGLAGPQLLLLRLRQLDGG